MRTLIVFFLIILSLVLLLQGLNNIVVGAQDIIGPGCTVQDIVESCAACKDHEMVRTYETHSPAHIPLRILRTLLTIVFLSFSLVTIL